jgi:hypothetical protein
MMFALPPVASPLFPGVDCPWLPPIRFGMKPYLDFCRAFDQELAALESRYPSHRPVLTLSQRNKRLQRRPK